jgi:hypothetical protein
MSIHIEEGKTLGMWSVTLPKDFQYDENHVGGDWLCHLGYEEKDGERITVGLDTTQRTQQVIHSKIKI